VTFPTPAAAPSTGAGLQEFRVWVRKSSSGGNACALDIELWESGVLVANLGTSGTITSTTGVIVSFTWDATLLGTASGANVEARVDQSSGGGGNPTNRKGLEVGAVEWNAALPNSAISGTIAVAFDKTADLKGTGTLTATAPIAFDSTADLADAAPAGAIDGTIAISTTESANLKGGGTLAGTIPAAVSETATLNGIGALTTQGLDFDFDSVADLTGRGALAATEAIAFTETGAITGKGDLAATENIAFADTANLDICIPFEIALSANIAASGENTTSRLTGGGVFGGGRIQDDENPADSVDLGANESGEWAWNLIGTDCAVDGIGYDFRIVYDDGTELDTYSQIPTWTPTAAGGISGTITLTFGDSATITATGDLAASAAMAFDSTADLLAKASLEATEAILFDQTADLKGAGALAGTIPATFGDTATLAGQGVLQGTGSMTFTQTANLVGAGVLAGLAPEC
jgi:hypothetical protein